MARSVRKEPRYKENKQSEEAVYVCVCGLCSFAVGLQIRIKLKPNLVQHHKL